mmetsp:Transcript_78831/g.255701  ORF Transcript_78831/g.255701 Transcript_78831/m.255701 type:complete len:319 (-) Transcript_78831:1083-2039(-)
MGGEAAAGTLEEVWISTRTEQTLAGCVSLGSVAVTFAWEGLAFFAHGFASVATSSLSTSGFETAGPGRPPISSLPATHASPSMSSSSSSSRANTEKRFLGRVGARGATSPNLPKPLETEPRATWLREPAVGRGRSSGDLALRPSGPLEAAAAFGFGFGSALGSSAAAAEAAEASGARAGLEVAANVELRMGGEVATPPLPCTVRPRWPPAVAGAPCGPAIVPLGAESRPGCAVSFCRSGAGASKSSQSSSSKSTMPFGTGAPTTKAGSPKKLRNASAEGSAAAGPAALTCVASESFAAFGVATEEMAARTSRNSLSSQ